MDRRTVVLSDYPDLVVIYLGMRVNALTGLKTLIGFGPKIDQAIATKPPGLLLHETIIYSLFPPHVGMRQYWQNFESLERWARSEPHRLWWQKFLKNTGGTGFWHEAYFMRGGMEAVYVDIPVDIGLRKFAPQRVARGPMFGARDRAARPGRAAEPAPISELELYGSVLRQSPNAVSNKGDPLS
jgi:hypothetical protein